MSATRHSCPTAPRPVRAPVGLLAELTHRCPLQCPYCSNPLDAGACRRRAADRGLARRAGAGGRSRRPAVAPVGRRADRASRSRGDRGAGGQGRALLQPHHVGRARSTRERLEKLASARPRPRADLDPGRARPPTPIASPTTAAATPGSSRWPAGCARCGLPLTDQRARASPEHRRPARDHRACRRASARSGSRWRTCSTTAGRCATAQALMPTRRAGARQRRAGESGRASGSRASSSSTSWCPTTTPSGRSPAWAAGGAASSTSRRRARCCPAMPPRPSRASPSTTCATGASRHLAPFRCLPDASAAPTGCGALPLLRAARGRLGRLPLPGLRLRRRCGRHRSGLRQVLAARGVARTLPSAKSARRRPSSSSASPRAGAQL